MRERRATYTRFLIIFAILGSLGLGAAAYLLVMQRASVPFRDVYTVRADFTEADGVLTGIGQPVNVAGVKVGQVTAVDVVNGLARVELEIDQNELPRVYRNATLILEPITPLKDMQIALDPGDRSAGALASDGTLGVNHTSPPVPLSDLLSSLDTDTRTALTSFIAAFEGGTRGRGLDMRRMLRALGPTTAQLGAISRSLAGRREELARLVHNLAEVTHAASRDHQLAEVITAGNQTLQALAAQDVPLRQAIARLPGTLSVTNSTLVHARPFAAKLGPTLSALRPGVDRLPGTLRSLRNLSSVAASALRSQIRPLVEEAQPVVRDAGPVVTDLTQASPDLISAGRALNYFFNELAYNAPGDDEGGLFWLSWFVHNVNSLFSTADAHGGIGRLSVMVNCNSVTGLEKFQQALSVFGLCPK